MTQTADQTDNALFDALWAALVQQPFSAYLLTGWQLMPGWRRAQSISVMPIPPLFCWPLCACWMKRLLPGRRLILLMSLKPLFRKSCWKG